LCHTYYVFTLNKHTPNKKKLWWYIYKVMAWFNYSLIHVRGKTEIPHNFATNVYPDAEGKATTKELYPKSTRSVYNKPNAHGEIIEEVKWFQREVGMENVDFSCPPGFET